MGEIPLDKSSLETVCGKICGKVCFVSIPPVPLNLYLSTSIRHPVKTGYESERQDHTQGIARGPEYPALRRARNLQSSHNPSKKIVIEKPSMRTAFIRMEGDPALFRRGLLLFRCRRLGLPSPAPMTAARFPVWAAGTPEAASAIFSATKRLTSRIMSGLS